MNKLNNIVVENLSIDFGKELNKTFEELGVDTCELGFLFCKEYKSPRRFYGLINNSFDWYSEKEVQQSNAKIITLEQLKAMKNPYPKMMYVSNEKNFTAFTVNKREIIFEKEIEGHVYYFTKRPDKSFYSFKYAVDLDYFDKQVKEITIEEIAQRFGYPINQIIIKK